jgi:hypothetical protein
MRYRFLYFAAATQRSRQEKKAAAPATAFWKIVD